VCPKTFQVWDELTRHITPCSFFPWGLRAGPLLFWFVWSIYLAQPVPYSIEQSGSPSVFFSRRCSISFVRTERAGPTWYLSSDTSHSRVTCESNPNIRVCVQVKTQMDYNMRAKHHHTHHHPLTTAIADSNKRRNPKYHTMCRDQRGRDGPFANPCRGFDYFAQLVSTIKPRSFNTILFVLFLARDSSMLQGLGVEGAVRIYGNAQNTMLTPAN